MLTLTAHYMLRVLAASHHSAVGRSLEAMIRGPHSSPELGPVAKMNGAFSASTWNGIHLIMLVLLLLVRLAYSDMKKEKIHKGYTPLQPTYEHATV